MGAAALLLAFLSLFSVIFLHPVAADCVPRSATNPLYPFVNAPGPLNFSKPRQPPAKQAPTPPGPNLDVPTPSSSFPPPFSIAFEGPVKGICSHTDHPDLCFSAIEPFLPIIGVIDAAALLGLQIKAAAAQTHAARDVSAKIAGHPTTEKLMSTILQTCLENYDDALDNLTAANKALVAQDMGTLYSMLSAAITEYSTCEEGFVETPAFDAPTTPFDDTLTKVVSNCLAIADLIKFK